MKDLRDVTYYQRRYRIGGEDALTREAMALLEELLFVDASEAQVPNLIGREFHHKAIGDVIANKDHAVSYT